MNTNGNVALAKVEPSPTAMSEYGGLEMVVSPAEALRRIQELQAFVAKVMVRNVDFGVIPGTGDKPCLLQPGAQKLAEMYGFSWSFEDTGSVSDWDKGFFLSRKRCVLTSRRTGLYLGDGIGSCNSREDRYAWRWLWDLPKGVDRATVKTRQTRTGKTQYRFANEDIYSLVNTIEKMACKRALVHAVIGATRSSGLFTQDVEDLPRDAFGEPEAVRSWEKDEAKDEAAATPKKEPTINEYANEALNCTTEEALNAVWKRSKGAREHLSEADIKAFSSHFSAIKKEIKARAAQAEQAAKTAQESHAVDAEFEPASPEQDGR